MRLRLTYHDPQGELRRVEIPFLELMQWMAYVREMTLDLKIGPPFQGMVVPPAPLPEPPRRGKPPAKP
jgi:hypothetical protein